MMKKMEYPFKDLLPLDEVLEREGYYKDWTHLDPKVFYSLTQISEMIKTKGYGTDVRLLIAQLAEHFGLSVVEVTDIANGLIARQSAVENRQETVETQFDAVQRTATEATDWGAEIIVASDGETTLAKRLERDKSEVTNQFNQKITDLNGVAKMASDYGFVPDYTGFPLYDGGDNLRVSATDNTAAFHAMLLDAKEQTELTVHFPSGHFGIIDGNIRMDMDGAKLTLVGTGETTIDFIKESGYQSSDGTWSNSNYIAYLDNLDFLLMRNIHLKATTDRSNPNGDQTDPDAVYYGRVQGLFLNKIRHARFENVKVSRFNYCGINIFRDNADAQNLNELIEIINCEGFENKSTGFMLQDTELAYVEGGEYHHNGQRGTMNTGYGISFSRHVNKAIVRNAYFHHNYRKGLDAHCSLDLDVENCKFDSNLWGHVYVAAWGQYVDSVEINLINLTISQSDIEWMRSCYNAAKINGFKFRSSFLMISDTNSSGVKINTIKKINIKGLKVLSAYNGGDVNENVNSNSFTFIGNQTELDISNSDFQLQNLVVNSTGYTRSSFPFTLEIEKFSWKNNNLNWPESSLINNVPKTGGLFNVLPTLSGKTFEIIQSTFELNDSFLVCRSSSVPGAEDVDPSQNGTGSVLIANVTSKWNEMPVLGYDTRYFGDINSHSSVVKKSVVAENIIAINGRVIQDIFSR